MDFRKICSKIGDFGKTCDSLFLVKLQFSLKNSHKFTIRFMLRLNANLDTIQGNSVKFLKHLSDMLILILTKFEQNCRK